ncbi:TPA: hypothetical protein EYP37_00650 [Candidatus Poribacteria bacterium]|nr:hypothetical protein [Candidatus Poribacteria bacterium]
MATSTFIIILAAAVAVLIIALVAYKKLYKKIPADAALVVSGGKRKRAYFGGKLVNPITCRTQEIPLNTMNLKVERKGQEALITKDSLRVDIVAEFFVRIQPNEEDVLAAAASLGEKIATPASVSELLEGKLVGALRSVAATMTLQELHEQRQAFADAVQEACSEDLKQNGFTLETVSITSLDQTPLDQLDPHNRFDATAIQTIKQEVEEKQTLTAKIEAENRVRREEDKLKAELEIKAKETETQKQILELERDRAFAEEEQKKEIETKRIEQQKAIQEAELEQKKAIEQARIAQEQAVEEVQIQKTLAVETARIEQERMIRETEAESAIRIAMREKEREQAEIERLSVSAERARAEEQVNTAKLVEEAERESKIKLIEAERKAQEEFIAKQKAAEAELEAAKLKAEAMRILAQAELEKAKAEAEGQKAIIEAKNIAEQKVLTHEAVLNFIQQLPTITERLMKPAERIESIRVLDLGGMGGGESSISRITGAILGAGAAVPLFKEILDLSGVDFTKLARKAAEYIPTMTAPEKEKRPTKQGETQAKEE